MAATVATYIEGAVVAEAAQNGSSVTADLDNNLAPENYGVK